MGKNSSRNCINRRQNRGKGRPLTARGVENIHNGLDGLRLALGVPNIPEEPQEGKKQDDFGIEAVLAGIGLIAIGGLVNIIT